MELNEALALELLEMADKYLLEELKDLCEVFLCENLALDNISDLARIAEVRNLNIRRKTIINFVPRNYKKILENQNLYKLPDSFYWEIITNLIENK